MAATPSPAALASGVGGKHPPDMIPTTSGGAPGRPGWLTAYYLATPLFLVPDLLLGAPVRVAALGSPGLRFAYYAAAFLLGLLVRSRPRLEPWVGLVESAGNLTLLVLSVMVPVLTLPGRVLEGSPVADLLGPVELVSAGLSGTVPVAAFHGHQAEIARRLRG